MGKGKILCIAFIGPTQLATGGADNRLRLWDLKQRVEIGELTGPLGSVASLAYSPRYRLLAAGCFDTTARVWAMADEVSVEKLEVAGPPEPVSVRAQSEEKR